MSRFVLKLPDLGEGTVQAEIVGWHVKPGDLVSEDDVLVEVMTDKAAVEVPSPVAGRVVSIHGEAGERLAVGSELAVFEIDTAQETRPQPKSPTPRPADSPPPQAPAAHKRRVVTSPAIRRRAHEGGIDLREVPGTGPNGRIVREDLDAFLTSTAARSAPVQARSVRPEPEAPAEAPASQPAAEGTREIKVVGVRRLIAERMSEAARTIPHFSYVEEVDVTELESLRHRLNSKRPSAPPLTYLPFLGLALVRVLPRMPQCNAHYDAARGVLIQHAALHLGIATQTPDGLKVPVVRNVQTLSLWELSEQIRTVTAAAKAGAASRAELTGSTLTITSLGKLGGLASTPLINIPEVAIIGVNRAVERPVVVDGEIVVRRMMNLSSSFDHRFIDGYDAAALIQALKERLEEPVTLFMDLPGEG